MSRGTVPKHNQQPPGVVQNWSMLQCSKQNTEQFGYDHAPVTRGRIRAQFPLPHGPPPTPPLPPPYPPLPPPPTSPPYLPPPTSPPCLRLALLDRGFASLDAGTPLK